MLMAIDIACVEDDVGVVASTDATVFERTGSRVVNGRCNLQDDKGATVEDAFAAAILVNVALLCVVGWIGHFLGVFAPEDSEQFGVVRVGDDAAVAPVKEHLVAYASGYLRGVTTSQCKADNADCCTDK